MTIVQQIESVLLSPELETIWQESLDTWEDGTPEEISAALAQVHHLRDRFLEVIKDVDDPETIHISTAVRYIELKCRWMMLNTQIQYRTVRGDSLNLSHVYEASLTSLLLEAFESLLDFSDVEKITGFLSQPIRASDEEFDELPLAA